MMYSQHCLVLFPVEPDAVLSQAVLTGVLQAQGVIGDELEPDYYKIGEQFLSLICFLGCSPFIELEPQKDKPFCYVQVPDAAAQPLFMAGRNVKVPRCPACKTPYKELVEQLLAVTAVGDDVLAERTCRECGTAFLPAERNWRKSAVFARTRIVIGNIHESEAVPDAALMQALAAASGVEWQYAYLRGD